jgi:pyruvate kinase
MRAAVPRTKVVCTLGPASATEGTLRALLEAGLDVARINFSHGTHADHAAIVARVRDLAQELGKPVAILGDLQGPRLRIGDLASPVAVEPGKDVVLAPEALAGPADLPVTYDDIVKDVRLGSRILINDGLIELVVVGLEGGKVQARVVHGGTITSHKGINLPGVDVSAPSLTDKDKADIAFAIQQDFDYLGLSFVRRPEDVTSLKALLPKPGPLVIAKIEKDSALTQIDRILPFTDGVMVARGDLGVELPYEQVPLAQKRIITLANRFGKPVITATQMLESMIHNPRPTRAEASDVANAILDGTDAVMLSAETAAGAYPTHAVRVMRRIITEVEKTEIPRRRAPDAADGGHPPRTEDVIAEACAVAAGMLGTPVLVVFTKSGGAARTAAAHRPGVPILAMTDNPRTYRQLALVWGVIPELVPHQDTYEQMLAIARGTVARRDLAGPGDRIIVTAGVPFDTPGSTNTLKIEVV